MLQLIQIGKNAVFDIYHGFVNLSNIHCQYPWNRNDHLFRASKNMLNALFTFNYKKLRYNTFC